MRSHFRPRESAQVGPHQETSSGVSNPAHCPDEDKTAEYVVDSESLRSFSTQEPPVLPHRDPRDPSSNGGKSYVSSGSARTDACHDQAIYPELPAAYESAWSPIGNLKARLSIAYRRIRRLPVSPDTGLTSDPRALADHKQSSLPNPHTTHARSRSQSIPSSRPHKSRPASWTHAGLSGTPPFRHPQAQAQSPKRHSYPPSTAQCALQIDTNAHLNDHHLTTLVRHSQSMILQPVLAAPVHIGMGGPLMPRQEVPVTAEPLLRKGMSKLIKRHSASAPPHSSTSYHLSPHVGSEKVTSVSSNQEFNSNEDICIQGHLPLVNPTPIQLDIPTHQPWRERRANFELSPKRGGHHNRGFLTSPLTAQKTSPSTEALASLAWTGTSQMGTSVSTSRIPPYYTKSNTVPGNPEINISMAVDENLPDEVVVERLEIIRRQGTRKDKHPPMTTSLGLAGTPLSSKRGFAEFQLREYSASNSSATCQSEEYELIQQSLPASVILDDTELDSVDSDDAAVWHTARKALFCIREIIRTERKYQEALKALLAGQTANPPPPLMLSYLPDLIRVSEALLKAFLDDPSAWGVSTAFMACEDNIEAAMVSWSSVAGNFFTDSPSKETDSASIKAKWRRRKSLLLSTGSPLLPVPGRSRGHSPPASPTALPLIRSFTSETGSRIRQRTDGHYRKVSNDGSVESSTTERSSPGVNSVDEKDGRADDSKRGSPTRSPSVRDLAIQPTQRVMRYVLMYQDLLENTPPTSPSRALVERALKAATHIASKCDRAQGNIAFLRR
ncbi:hypothetical protein K503DRAFT_798430 [Rhizopogon vinicolor AM-OR11-026]|uniref:DH domain-containing protein n=1 Tax=Rhizopogon vinicolor AM-OR11-026 TaxID=1314800 RepID=A0A1B7N7R2_9AGAM|nr:hypothetical protein K503DRAFT_798430 [Rhizopogon vinicolor AM-OR11-026]